MFAHIDADAFFASVLQRSRPELRGKEILALGMGGGCVIAASYEAKAKGVKTGMPLKDAKKLVPNAIAIPADFAATGIASRAIEAILGDLCPLIEQMSIDEWFLDLRKLVGGLPRNMETWATTLRGTILARTGLSMSVGVAPSKILAKMASEYRKPGGVTIVGAPSTAGAGMAIPDFLRDRPAAAIPGIGRRTQPKTDAHGWQTAWDIAQAPTATLVTILGRPGRDLQQELRGIPVSQIAEEEALPKSVSRCRSFPPTTDATILWAHALRHLEYAVMKMRRSGLACRGVSLWVRTDRTGGYAHTGANVSFPHGLDTVEALLPPVQSCFREILRTRTSYTQIGLALWHLVDGRAVQESLFEAPQKSAQRSAVQATLDLLHGQFGRNAITRGSAMTVKTGMRPVLDGIYE